MCEEFHCLPAEAGEALENDEGGIILTIINLRSYAHAKNSWDTSPKTAKGPAVEQVKEIELELAGIDLQLIKENTND